jgi:SAM-dependent methyltransferase
MAGKSPGFDAWLDGPLGRTLVAAEAEVLADALEDVFGWELLQVGQWGEGRALLQGARTRTQTILASAPPPVSGAGSDPGRWVVGRLAQLPLANDSVEAVLLPHTLEFEPDPYAVVREVDRVLGGEGQLLVLGFRPMSLWGARAAVTRAGFPPGIRRLLPVGRLRDWLVLFGYEIVDVHYYLYHRPWGVPRSGDGGRAQFLRRGFLNPLPAGAYLMKARKRVYTLTPIRPRFRERRPVLGGLVEPTSRTRS